MTTDALLSNISQTVHRVEDKVDSVVKDHGRRLGALEVHAERSVALDGEVRGLQQVMTSINADVRQVINDEREAWRHAMAEERQAWQEAMSEERKSWTAALSVERARVRALEDREQQRRGAAWVVGIVWTVVVSLPGLIALFLSLMAGGSSAP